MRFSLLRLVAEFPNTVKALKGVCLSLTVSRERGRQPSAHDAERGIAPSGPSAQHPPNGPASYLPLLAVGGNCTEEATPAQLRWYAITLHFWLRPRGLQPRTQAEEGEA